MTKITIELSNSKAEVLYGILVNSVEESTSELKRRRVLNKDGNRRKNKKYLSDYEESIMDTLLLSEYLYKWLEPQLDTFKEEL